MVDTAYRVTCLESRLLVHLAMKLEGIWQRIHATIRAMLCHLVSY